jgi:hypothetical protein
LKKPSISFYQAGQETIYPKTSTSSKDVLIGETGLFTLYYPTNLFDKVQVRKTDYFSVRKGAVNNSLHFP